MADLARMESALRNAHAAGDTAAAKQLANALKAARSQGANTQQEYVQPAPPEGMVLDPNTGQMVDTAAAAERMLSKPMGRVATTGAQFASGYPVVGGLLPKIAGMGNPVREETARQALKQYEQQNPNTTTALNVGGAITGIAPLIAAAPAMFGASGTAGLAGNTLAATGSGAAVGAADSAVRSGGNLNDMRNGAAIGALTGGAGPAIGKGLGGAANMLRGVFGVQNPKAANRVIRQALERSGMSIDDLTADMSSAVADGNTGYMMADALGNAGQRTLAGMARTPSDARSRIVEALTSRQMGQGERIGNFLADGLGAADTAAQRAASLSSARQSAANANYGAAREGAGTVDPSKAIALADDFLSPNAQSVMGGNNIAADSVEGAVSRARSYLTDGKSVVSDFDKALRSKIELDNMIETGSGSVRSQLKPIRDALDEALARSSNKYGAARDTYRQQSKAIDAVEAGKLAAGPRQRADDTVRQFGAMGPDEQSAFRSGYSDPLIARVESASMSPTTNKARPLLTPKSAQELPAFAVPGKGEQLMRRLSRENKMFETGNAAMGGSKTADNLMDAAETSGLDLGILGSLLRGNLKEAAIQGGVRGVGAVRGVNDKTRQLIVDALMQADPAKARAGVVGAIERSKIGPAKKQQIIRALTLGPATVVAGGGGGGY